MEVFNISFQHSEAARPTSILVVTPLMEQLAGLVEIQISFTLLGHEIQGVNIYTPRMKVEIESKNFPYK